METNGEVGDVALKKIEKEAEPLFFLARLSCEPKSGVWGKAPFEIKKYLLPHISSCAVRGRFGSSLPNYNNYVSSFAD